MQKKPDSIPDFFDGFHASRARLYVLPGILGFFVAVALVGLSHTGNMRGLMANVANVTLPTYSADLVIRQTDAGTQIILGKDAQSVDTIEFRLLSDPSDGLIFAPNVGTATVEGEGVIRYVRSLEHVDLPAGTVIAQFAEIRQGNPLALTDAEFVSGGVRYSLTSKSE